MSLLIIGIVIAAIFHFVYEAIIAPSLRLKIRFELFALRDKLRELKINHGDTLDNKHFKHLQDSINSIILMLPRFDVGMLTTMERELDRNNDLKLKLNERIKILDDCNIPEAMEIRTKSLNLAHQAFFVNIGGFVLLILPLVFWNVMKKRIKTVVSLSKPDLEKIDPTINSSEIFAA
jgi:hypothetical protein